MNYGQVRDQVLKLLNQYTVAGVPVAESYNNQQDYLNRIPALVNDAMTEIATTVRKIPATLELDLLEPEIRGDQLRYELPENFFQFISGSVVKNRDGQVLHTNTYLMRGKKYLLLPAGEGEHAALDYYRYPMLLGDRPGDDEELDNAPETHFAVPFYAAAFLVDHDDPYLCSLFYNKYEDKLNGMREGLSAEIRPVRDRYQFFG